MPEKAYYINDPDADGLLFFDTEEEMNEHFDYILVQLVDAQIEGVDKITMGELKPTHKVKLEEKEGVYYYEREKVV